MNFERPSLAALSGYVPGEQPADARVIKLNTNENPYPPSDAVAECLRSFDVDSLRRYPPPLANEFRNQAASLHGIKAENIIATNGGDELLRLAFTTFVEPGETIAVMEPSYSLYPVLAKIQGCKVLSVPLLEDWSMPGDLAQSLNHNRVKMLLLVNPHAPTGVLLDTDYLGKLLQEFSGVILLDEAYVDFVDTDLHYNAIPLINSYDNLLILRTLSKGYSLAGLRFGYGIGAASIISPILGKTRDSYNTDALSQKLAVAALSAADAARANADKVRRTRSRLVEGLNLLGLQTRPSQSNFVLAQVPAKPGAARLYEQLKARQILVRYFDQERLCDKLRISVGTDAETDSLLESLRELLG